jgi:hypothetical protein
MRSLLKEFKQRIDSFSDPDDLLNPSVNKYMAQRQKEDERLKLSAINFDMHTKDIVCLFESFSIQ